jgi:hypothetical protein
MDCNIHGCVKKVFAAGLCHRHYEEERLKNAPPCSIDGCEGKAERSGMCNAHYRRHRLAAAPPCTVKGCGRPQFVGGHCQTHHKRVQRYGSLDADRRAHDRGARRQHPLYESWRWHSRFQSLAPEWQEDFWSMVEEVGERPSVRHVLRRKNGQIKMGPGNWHWMETFESPDAATRMREYRSRNPDTFRNIDLKRNYGITLAEYNSILEKQGGVCAICGKPESAKDSNSGVARNLAVDHCHETGRVRGLLCTGCNTAIGKLTHDDGTLEAAKAYLRRK